MLNSCGLRSVASADAHSLYDHLGYSPRDPSRGTLPAPAGCDTTARGTRRMRHHAARQHPTASLLQPAAPSFRAHSRHSKRHDRRRLRCWACQQRDAAVTAGIPLSGEVLTDPGQRLVGMLLDGSMQQFVPAVTAALQEVGLRC